MLINLLYYVCEDSTCLCTLTNPPRSHISSGGGVPFVKNLLSPLVPTSPSVARMHLRQMPLTRDTPMTACRIFTSTVALLALICSGSFERSACAQDPDWALKMFDARNHDFGHVARGAEVKHRFKVTNIYKETVHIRGVRTSCSCSIAKPPEQATLKSLESTYIEVEFDTRKHKHAKTSNLIVSFDAPLVTDVTIPLKGYIRSDVVLTPGSANFGMVDLGQGATRKISVAYAGRPDWTLRDVKTGSEHVTAEIRELSRNGGLVNYEVELALKPDVPAGKFTQQVTLVTDDASPYVPMLVTASVESDITVATPDVTLGPMTPGQSRQFSVVIRGRKPFTIGKVECESEDGHFKMRLPDANRTLHVVPMTFTAPETAGKYSEVFTVTIEGRDQPVTFRASAEITEPAA